MPDTTPLPADQREIAYVRDGALVVPWRITDPFKDYQPRIGDPIIAHKPYAHEGEIIELLTPAEFAALPDGTLVVSISGEEKVKGRDAVDQDTRAGRLAWGLLAIGEAQP